MKPKVALVKDGFLPPGSENKRGRLSGPAIARCEELAGQGWDIEGYVVSSKPTADTSKPVTVERVKVDPSRVIDCPDPLRDTRDFKAFVTDGTKVKEIGNRTVCNGCHNSLPYCFCATPRVWLDHERESVVTFTFTQKGAG